MTVAQHASLKVVFNASVLLAVALLASSCARHPKAIPTWGGNPPPVTAAPATTYTPAPAPREVQTYSWNGRSTFTQDCTGSFSVRDARTNREISNGRAYNSGSGLIALDARGRQTRAISSAASQSVIFLPDCNCRAGANQSGNLPSTHQFTATAPTAAACSAG